jgi:hypothetical protein
MRSRPTPCLLRPACPRRKVDLSAVPFRKAQAVGRFSEGITLSVLGMWVIGPMREDQVARFTPHFQSALVRHAARPEIHAAWQAWCDDPALVPGRFRDPQRHPTYFLPHPNVGAFEELAYAVPWGDPEVADLDLLSARNYDETVSGFVVSVRKGSPVAALFHGIGPARARLLPGWFGNFLLTPDEVRALRSQVESALTIPADEYPRVLERVRDWLNGMGDSGDEDAEKLLIGPMRIWRDAARAGLGLCATQTWV